MVATVPNVTAGAATDVGRVRQLNEDRHYLGGRIFCVADGMGGHAAGDIASDLTIQVLAALEHEPLTRDALRRGIRQANDRVLEYAAGHPEATGLGTTVAGVAELDEPAYHWAIFHVGDSRVYTFEDGVLQQLTVDHSEVAELIAAGTITTAEARNHPSRHIITRAVGEWPAPELDILLLPAGSDRRFLICSDGLTGELEDEQVAATMARGMPPADTAQGLVIAAVEHGGLDNVTVVVIDESGGEGFQATTVPRGRLGDPA